MKFLLGTKQYMTQYFHADGKAEAATALTVAPLTVTQVRTDETDGYTAVQVGFGSRREKTVNKPQLTAWKDLGVFRHVMEFPITGGAAYKKGDSIAPETVFTAGDTISVSGISKGKGFQGVVKRHGFGGGRRTHGQKHSEREPGSIGGGGRAGGRVVKGMRMAGRMGGTRQTIRNLKVLAFDQANNILLVKGAVPGRKGTLLEIRGNE